MKRLKSLYVKDMLDAIDKINEFTENMTFEEFLLDDKTSSAVVRKLEIIGEAVKQIGYDTTKQFPDIPWSSLAKLRDKIIHFYHGIDYELIWEIIKFHLPHLKPKLYEVLNKLSEEEK